MKKNDKFYDSEKWRRIRESALKRDQYLDQYEKRFGRYVQAELVHHIIPRENHPEYQYELWNLISLSKISHNKMHVRDTCGLTETGVELLYRACRKNGIPIPAEYLGKEKKKHRGKKPKWRNYYDDE